MGKALTLLCLLCTICMGARADELFRQHRYDTFKVEPIDEHSIVFVGNSITDMHLWEEAFGNDPRIVNRGNSGGKSAEILANVRSYCVGHPAKIFLLIGINDKPAASNQEEIVDNIRQTVATICEVSPSTQIYVQSILPSGRDGFSTPADIARCNAAIKQMLENHYPDVTYIDIYSRLLGKVNNGGDYSFDLLHLTAASYAIWTKELEQYLPGCTSVYPSDTEVKQTRSSLPHDSFGMRGTYFSMMPVTPDDVLFFGDEMVKNGAWNELLRNYNVKNRGTNWGYDHTSNSMAYTAGNIDCTFAPVEGITKKCPRQVLLYTGTGEVNNERIPVTEAIETYKGLVAKLRDYTSTTTKISLVSLMPTQGYDNGRVRTFNKALADLAATDPYLEFVDIYSPLATAEGAARLCYFPACNGYLYGDGYIVVANILANHIRGCKPVTPAQAAAYRELIEGEKPGKNSSAGCCPCGCE